VTRWVVALVAAVAALVLAVPVAVTLIMAQASCGSDPASAGGTETKGEAAVWQALRSAGFDAAHAAGVMGNMQAESGFDAQIVQGGRHSASPSDAGSAGYGLVQWTPGRKLSDYLGTAVPTVANEVATLKAQLAGQGPHPEGAAGAAFWAARDVESAARVFHLRYERSASTDSSQRVSNALSIYARHSSEASGAAAPGAAATPGVDDALALSTSTGQDAACTGMPAIRVMTWNSYYGAKHAGSSGPTGEARITFAMLAFGREADIIGGQEFSERSHKDAALAGLGDDWAAVALDTAHPIFYRKTRFTVVSDESQLVFKRGTPMEGPDQGVRYVNTVVLRETATGRTVTEVNFHEIPTIQKHGRLNTDQPRRAAVARHIYSVAMASAKAHESQGAVLVTCDCNYDGDIDGLAAAAGLTRAASVFGNPKQATRSRNIDQIMWRGGVPTSEQVLPAHGSDHSPRVVTFPATQAGAGSSGGGPVPAEFNQQGNPRTVEQAVAWMQANMPNGAPGEPVQGACERYMNLAYGLGGGYPTALSHWNAAGPRSKGYSTPPRGALVFWRTSNPAGHVALSLGNGVVVSTDYDASTHRYRAGTLSAGPITDIDKWGPRLGWRAPNFRVGSEAT